MIVCMRILISTGVKPYRAMEQMVWCSLIGLASLKKLETFRKSRKESATGRSRPRSRVEVHAALIKSTLDIPGGVSVP